jgi:hypothetical protein
MTFSITLIQIGTIKLLDILVVLPNLTKLIVRDQGELNNDEYSEDNTDNEMVMYDLLEALLAHRQKDSQLCLPTEAQTSRTGEFKQMVQPR